MKKPTQNAADPVLRKLTSPDEAERLVGIGFDFCMNQRLDRYISAERVLAQLDRATRSPFISHMLFAHLRPFLDREAARTEERGEPVEDYLTSEARQLLDDLAGRPVHLERRFLEGLMQQEAVRHLIRMIVVETINRFIKNLKGDGGGLLGQVGKLKIAKGLLTKIGKQIESRLQAAAASFVQSSLDLVMKTVVHTISSPEMADHLGKLTQAGFRAAIALKTAVPWQALLRQPLDDLLALVPGLLRHNLDREHIRQAVLEEVGAALEAEESKTIRQIVNDDDLMTHWREECKEVGGALLSEFVGTVEFRNWTQM